MLISLPLAIIAVGVIVAFVGTRLGVRESRRTSSVENLRTSGLNTGIVLFLIGIAALIFGLGYLGFVLLTRS